MSLRFLTTKFCATTALAIVSLGATGCNETYVWVGPVFDTDAVAILTVNNGEVRAYSCGGATSYQTHTHWFDGRVGGSNGFSATSSDGWSMEGGLNDSYAFMSLISPDSQFFSADGSPETEDLAGLYAVEDSGCLTGVIVWYGGSSEPKLQGTWCDDMGNFAQVTPVYPIERTSDGIHVQVDLGPLGEGGMRDLYVTKEAAR